MSFIHCTNCSSDNVCAADLLTPRTSHCEAADAKLTWDLPALKYDDSSGVEFDYSDLVLTYGGIKNVALNKRYSCDPCEALPVTYCKDTHDAYADKLTAGEYVLTVTTSDGSDFDAGSFSVYDGLCLDVCAKTASMPKIPFFAGHGADGAIEGMARGGTGTYVVTLQGFNKNLLNEKVIARSGYGSADMSDIGEFATDPRLGYVLSQNITRDRFAFTDLEPGQYTVTVQDCEHYVSSSTVSVEVNYFAAIARLVFLILLAPIFVILLKQVTSAGLKSVSGLGKLFDVDFVPA